MARWATPSIRCIPCIWRMVPIRRRLGVERSHLSAARQCPPANPGRGATKAAAGPDACQRGRPRHAVHPVRLVLSAASNLGWVIAADVTNPAHPRSPQAGQPARVNIPVRASGRPARVCPSMKTRTCMGWRQWRLDPPTGNFGNCFFRLAYTPASKAGPAKLRMRGLVVALIPMRDERAMIQRSPRPAASPPDEMERGTDQRREQYQQRPHRRG